MKAKPKLVYFQWNHFGLPKFLQLHVQLHIKCLSEFFEVVLVNYDCNYKQICDTYEPDLVLFESGYKSNISRKLIIKDTSSYSEIPKIGLHNGDSWCDCRVGFISDMEHWNINTFFTISTTTAEHTPILSDNLYVWPNFIDSDIYHDYGEKKVNKILLNGIRNSLYPWRQKICAIIENHFETVSCKHTGYEKQTASMVYGEDYARLINASWLMPACGTIAKEVVRKHFEIPGAKSCLVTEKSPSLDAAGFVDMQNCVFADESDILDKLKYLFENIDDLTRITAAGYDLVHSFHTLKQRNQIYQWFNLYKSIKHGEKIIQNNPFGPLSLVKASSNICNRHIVGGGLHLKLLSEGDSHLWTSRFDEAEVRYLKCLKFIPWMSEPKLKLAVCYLYKGDASQALRWVLDSIQQNLGTYSRAFRPDPIEWAYYVIALLCNGKLNEALIRSNQYCTLVHPELNRTRLIIKYLVSNEVYKAEIINKLPSQLNYSIHQFPHLNTKEWITNLQAMLIACQQLALAEKLNALISFEIVDGESLIKANIISINSLQSIFLEFRVRIIQKLNSLFDGWNVPNRNTGLPSISIYDYCVRLGKWAQVDKLKKFLQRLCSSI